MITPKARRFDADTAASMVFVALWVAIAVYLLYATIEDIMGSFELAAHWRALGKTDFAHLCDLYAYAGIVIACAIVISIVMVVVYSRSSRAEQHTGN